MHEVGEKVLVKDLFSDTYETAIIAGHYRREIDHRDANGSNIIAKAGIVYKVRYKEDGGLYNVYQDRVYKLDKTP